MKGLQHIMAFFQRSGGAQPSLRSGRNGSRPAPWTGGSPAKEKLSTCMVARPALSLCPECGQRNPAQAAACARCGTSNSPS